MSGYLEHVLARASGQGPALRPRPRSRFEPDPAGHVVPQETLEAALPAAAEPADTAGLVMPRPGLEPPAAVHATAPEPALAPAAVAGAVPRASERPTADLPGGDLAVEPAPAEQAGGRRRTRASARRPDLMSSPAVVPPGSTDRAIGEGVPAAPAERDSPGSRRRAGPPQAGTTAPADPGGPAAVAAAPLTPGPRTAAGQMPLPASAPGGEASPAPANPAVVAGPAVPADHAAVADTAVAVGRAVAAGPVIPAGPAVVADHLVVAGPGSAVESQAATGSAPTRLAPSGPGRQARARPPTADRPARGRLDAAPAPTVNVTIGRVEVRPPPAPPPPPPVAAPGARPLSLDEYLERRNRGVP